VIASKLMGKSWSLEAKLALAGIVLGVPRGLARCAVYSRCCQRMVLKTSRTVRVVLNPPPKEEQKKTGPSSYRTDWSEEKTTFCTVYMHQPSDNSPCSNCTGHCAAPDGGTVTRFIRRDCDGTGCGWSYHPNPAKGYDPDVDISQDGHSIVWRRRYDDASPQTEKYYFAYKIPVKRCVENCEGEHP